MIYISNALVALVRMYEGSQPVLGNKACVDGMGVTTSPIEQPWLTFCGIHSTLVGQ